MLTVKNDETYGQLWNSLDGIYPSLNTEYDRVFDEKLPSTRFPLRMQAIISI